LSERYGFEPHGMAPDVAARPAPDVHVAVSPEAVDEVLAAQPAATTATTPCDESCPYGGTGPDCVQPAAPAADSDGDSEGCWHSPAAPAPEPRGGGPLDTCDECGISSWPASARKHEPTCSRITLAELRHRSEIAEALKWPAPSTGAGCGFGKCGTVTECNVCGRGPDRGPDAGGGK